MLDELFSKSDEEDWPDRDSLKQGCQVGLFEAKKWQIWPFLKRLDPKFLRIC